jgi:protein-L-isoaspartate(D-aspartate) O-methyltransferase
MTDFAALRRRMVENQIRPSEVSDHAVIAAFLDVPREIFVAPGAAALAYSDHPALMSEVVPERRLLEPAVLARLVQALPRGPGIKAMAVACGTGYAAAVLSRLVGTVVAVEAEEVLVEMAVTALKAVGAENAAVVRALAVEGCPPESPFDAILLEGAVEVEPLSLIGQLKPGGFLATIRRTTRTGRATLYERVGDVGAGRELFDAWAPVVPGFERAREFVF